MIRLHVSEQSPGWFAPEKDSELFTLQELVRPYDPNLWDTYRMVPLEWIVIWKNRYPLFSGQKWKQRRHGAVSFYRKDASRWVPDNDIQIVGYLDREHITATVCLMADWESFLAYDDHPALPVWDWYDSWYLPVSRELAQAVLEQHGYMGRRRVVATLSVSDWYESPGECAALLAYDEERNLCGRILYEPWRKNLRTRYQRHTCVGLHSGEPWWTR